MAMEQVFLDWRQPALPAVVNYLTERYEQNGVLDLSRVLLVLPGARAGRRLREILASEADRRGWILFPPDVTTVGRVPEKLYEPKRPFANDVVQKLAWADALRAANKKQLGEFLSDIPADPNDPRWLETGNLLWNLHRELASEALDFEQVVKLAAEEPDFGETSRWESLAKVQAEYLRILDGLGLWDRQTARQFAIKHGECQADADILLVATVDMNRLLRLMVDQVSDRVTALIHADRQHQTRFDEHGCLEPEAWQDFLIPIRDDQLVQADDPVDQGRAIVHEFVQLEGRFAAEEIAVGIPDENMVPLIQQQLEQAGLPSRWGPGQSVEASPPIRLLRIVIDYLQRPRFDSLSELVRHPDVEQWLIGQCGLSEEYLLQLDQFQNDYLPLQAREDWHGTQQIGELLSALEQLLGDLNTELKSPTAWNDSILGLLTQIYGTRRLNPELERDRLVLGGCEKVRDALRQLEQIPEKLSFKISVDQAILIALDVLENSQIPSPHATDSIEMLGWLELPLDDSPVLFVTGLNEGVVPKSANEDLFLPNLLRKRLGVNDNQRRYARDAYALSVLALSKSKLRVVLGRRDWEGNPLAPSRLLFATDEDTIVQRSLRFFGSSPESTINIELRSNQVDREHHGFFVPKPAQCNPIASLSVTDFKRYLECPYRFYLERVLRLDSMTDDQLELDGRKFGDVVHEVLKRFGEGDLKDAAEPEEISKELNGLLEQVTLEQFGKQPATAVQVQIAQMQVRLNTFAEKQAAWRRQGWRIVETECDVDTMLGPEDAPIKLRGRIDRIDLNDRTNECAVLDYKSSDQGAHPNKIHLGGKRKVPRLKEDWIDLQLPLYRHLAAKLGYQAPIQLGYIVLPRSTKDAGFELATWTAAELSIADEAANAVIEMIREERFWPPTDPPPPYSETLGSICQDRVFGRQLEGSA